MLYFSVRKEDEVETVNLLWETGMKQDLKSGLIIGAIAGAILGGLFQQMRAAAVLEDQVREGFMFCHNMLHAGDDTLNWMVTEPTELQFRHEAIECGWVGDTFQ